LKGTNLRLLATVCRDLSCLLKTVQMSVSVCLTFTAIPCFETEVHQTNGRTDVHDAAFSRPRNN